MDNPAIRQHLQKHGPVYVSVTGFKVRGWLRTLVFWRHAIPSFGAAQRAEGNLFVDARQVKGVRHTLSVWTSREAMLKYYRSEAHVRAMKAFPTGGLGSVFGYETREAPDWSEALARLEANGRPV